MHFSDLNIDSDSGFTLVEIIVSMLLLGFAAVGAILFLVSGVSGYVFSQQASAISQKANLALVRLTKELSGEMIEIELITSGSVKYVYQYNPEQKRYIALVGTGTRKEIKITTGANPAEPEAPDPGVLIDQVSAFTLEFQKYNEALPGWELWNVANPNDTMDNLGRINITLKLFINSYDDDTVDFMTTVSPSSHDYIIG